MPISKWVWVCSLVFPFGRSPMWSPLTVVSRSVILPECWVINVVFLHDSFFQRNLMNRPPSSAIQELNLSVPHIITCCLQFGSRLVCLAVWISSGVCVCFFISVFLYFLISFGKRSLPSRLIAGCCFFYQKSVLAITRHICFTTRPDCRRLFLVEHISIGHHQTQLVDKTNSRRASLQLQIHFGH